MPSPHKLGLTGLDQRNSSIVSIVTNEKDKIPNEHSATDRPNFITYAWVGIGWEVGDIDGSYYLGGVGRRLVTSFTVQHQNLCAASTGLPMAFRGRPWPPADDGTDGE